MGVNPLKKCVCLALLVQVVLSKSEHTGAYTRTNTHTHSILRNDDYRREAEDRRTFLPLNYNYYAIPPRIETVRRQNGDDGEVLQERLGRARTFPGTEIVLSDYDKAHLEELGEARPEDIEEAIEDMEPFFAKHMATMLIAYKLKMLILIPLFVVSVFMLAGSSGFAGLFFLLFVGSMWYRHKKGDPFPYKHELF